jgi:hypothetical protein
MKKSETSAKDLVFVALWTGFWTALGGGIFAGFCLLIKTYVPLVAILAIQAASYLLPNTKEILAICHASYWICIPMIVIPFSYVFWRENKYVSHMHKKRNALEAGKLRPLDLTHEEIDFIHSRWPDLFKKEENPDSPPM